MQPVLDADHGWLSVLAFDCGGSTGWSVGTITARALTGTQPLHKALRHHASGVIVGQELSVCKQILDLCEVWPDAVIVLEDFILRTAVRGREALSPVRINAVVGYFAWQNGRRVFLQQPVDAKKAWPDTRLRETGLYKTGPDHVRDADRHLMLFLQKLRDKRKLREQAWPERNWQPRSKVLRRKGD